MQFKTIMINRECNFRKIKRNFENFIEILENFRKFNENWRIFDRKTLNVNIYQWTGIYNCIICVPIAEPQRRTTNPTWDGAWLSVPPAGYGPVQPDFTGGGAQLFTGGVRPPRRPSWLRPCPTVKNLCINDQVIL